MADTGTALHGRLAGTKAATYLRAVNVPEARASAITAPIMLTTDLAYILSACELDLMPRDAARRLVAAVLQCLAGLSDRNTSTPPGDIVSQRDKWIAELADKDAASWIHLGRNRGESLRSLIPRLFFRDLLHDQGAALTALVRNLIDKADAHFEALAPNYHHLQHSGLTTVGEYLLSWAITFARHAERLSQVDARLDRGPSAFGGREQINRLYDKVVARLGFSRRAYLRRDGIWQQDQFTEPFFVLALISVDLARFAQDLRIWMTPEFSLFELADAHAGGSSGLPHAKVPFGLQEIVGAGVMASTRLAGEMATACAGPSEGSEGLYSSSTLYQAALDCVANTRYVADIIAQGAFQLEEMKRKALLDYAGSSEAHDRLVYDFGVPPKISHRLLGTLVRAHFYGEDLPDLNALLQAEVGRAFAVDAQEIMDIILVDIIWPTTFDKAALRRVFEEVATDAQAMAARYAGPSPTRIAMDRLIDDAQKMAADDVQNG